MTLLTWMVYIYIYMYTLVLGCRGWCDYITIYFKCDTFYMHSQLEKEDDALMPQQIEHMEETPSIETEPVLSVWHAQESTAVHPKLFFSPQRNLQNDGEHGCENNNPGDAMVC